MSDADDIETIREQKKEKLRAEPAEESAGDSTADEPIHAESESHFEEVTGSGGVVLVDFYADWCGPCQMLEPTVETIAETTAATVLKVDIDQYQGLARQYQVQGVPTLVVFADGQPVEKLVGLKGEDELRQVVEQYA